MTAPTTEFDARYSDDTSAPLPWSDIDAALDQAELFWISTVRDDGQPHVTPLIALWLDDALFFCTGPLEQKARNLALNPRCTFTTGCNTWAEGMDVVVEGTAIRITERARLQLVADGLERKYGAAWHFDVTDGGFTAEGVELAHVFEVEPARVYAFGKAPHSHTRYSFDEPASRRSR
jgi:nitroimidazol reductase NimA-like FMN-containing flavoprotein (pyridoxamine 5'-phosphate oxidase superfamily)